MKKYFILLITSVFTISCKTEKPQKQVEWVNDYMNLLKKYNTEDFQSIETKLYFISDNEKDLHIEIPVLREINRFSQLEKYRSNLKVDNSQLFADTTSFFDFYIQPGWTAIQNEFEYTYVDLSQENLYTMYRNRDQSISIDTQRLAENAKMHMFEVFEKYWKIKSSPNYEFYSCSDCPVSCFTFSYVIAGKPSRYAFTNELSGHFIDEIKADINRFVTK